MESSLTSVKINNRSFRKEVVKGKKEKKDAFMTKGNGSV